MPTSVEAKRNRNTKEPALKSRTQSPAVATLGATGQVFDLSMLQRAIADPSSTQPSSILGLQQTAGNRAVERLVQARLIVGAAHDTYEQEADRVAEQVVGTGGEGTRGRGRAVQRQGEEEEIQTKPLKDSPALGIQRQGEEEEIQTKRVSAAGSFEAGADLEQHLAAGKGRGSPLPAETRAFMEPRFGADFSAVRLHTGADAAQVSRSISAQAFTHGSDIYLGAGKYDPGSTAGKQLLAHELTHVVQQTGGRTQRKIQQKNGSLVQRNGVPPTEERQTRRGSLRLSGYRQAVPVPGPQPQQAVETIMPPPRRAILVSPGPRPQQAVETRLPSPQHATLTSPGPQPQHATLVSPAPQPRHFAVMSQMPQPQHATRIPPTGVNTGPVPKLPASAKRVLEIGRARGLTKSQLQGTDVSDGGGKLESAKTIVDMVGAPLSITDDRLVDAYRGAELKQADSGGHLVLPEGVFWTGAGVLSGIGGILSLAKSMKTLVSSEADAWEKVQAAFDYAATGADITASAEGIAGGISQIVSTQTGSDLASSTSSWCLGFQTMFSTLSKGIQTIKGVVELVKMIVGQAQGKKHGRDEWLAQGGAVLNNALQTAAGVVGSIRSIYEAIGGGVTDMFSSTIPGLDIAVAAVKSIMQGYYLVVSSVQIYRMHKRKKELQAKLLRKSNDPGMTKQILKQASNVYATYEGQLATVDELIAKNNDKIKSIEKANKGTKSRTQIEKLRKDNSVLTDRKAEINKAIVEHERLSHVSRKSVGELRLTRELRYTNIKRVTRQSIHIVANLIQVGASIATLVSGPGAPAALALKATAAGIDTSLPFFRWVKQQARNFAAKREARGGGPVSAKRPWLKLRTDKSSAGKLQERKREAVMILMMASKLNQYVPQGTSPRPEEIAKLKKHADRVENYIKATGCSPEKLYRANGKPMEQVKILVQELAKREFLE